MPLRMSLEAVRLSFQRSLGLTCNLTNDGPCRWTYYAIGREAVPRLKLFDEHRRERTEHAVDVGVCEQPFAYERMLNEGHRRSA